MTAIEDLVGRNAALRSDTGPGALAARPGLRPTWAVGTFRDPESDLRQPVEQVRRSPFLANTTAVRSFVMDVETGDLAEAAPSQP